jgi:hypothetical protein
MRSVPPRGSGWVGMLALRSRVDSDETPGHDSGHGRALSQRLIANGSTHPLPRGGTDLIDPPHE